MTATAYVVGLFPTFFLAASRDASKSLKFFGVTDFEAQLREYPVELLDELMKVHEVINKLVARGHNIRIVHSLSFLGLLLSLRHRMGTGFYLVFDRKAMKIENDVDGLIREISAPDLSKRRRKIRFMIV